MGVLNVTPDSFSDGGRFLDHEAAIEHGYRLIDEGAAIVDVGGESTRPGANPVGPVEEARRVVPVVAGLAGDVRVSIDTRHAEVARVAVTAGATIVNDVSASLGDVAADLGVGWVAMHMRGDPRTMQDGKTTRHNLELLAGLDVLVDTGWPVIVGASRKRFLGELTAASDGLDGLTLPDDRREASVAVATWAFRNGVQIVRAHDVRSTVQAAQVVG